MVIKQENFWWKYFREQRGSPWHTAALVIQCMWHLVDFCLSNSPRHVRTRCERNFSQGSLVKRFYNSDTMTWKRWRSHLRSTSWSHFKLLCLTIKWRRPIFGFSLLSPLPLLLHSRYVRWKEKNESFTNSFVFSLVKILNGDNFFLSFAFS